MEPRATPPPPHSLSHIAWVSHTQEETEVAPSCFQRSSYLSSERSALLPTSTTGILPRDRERESAQLGLSCVPKEASFFSTHHSTTAIKRSRFTPPVPPCRATGKTRPGPSLGRGHISDGRPPPHKGSSTFEILQCPTDWV